MSPFAVLPQLHSPIARTNFGTPSGRRGKRNFVWIDKYPQRRPAVLQATNANPFFPDWPVGQAEKIIRGFVECLLLLFCHSYIPPSPGRISVPQAGGGGGTSFGFTNIHREGLPSYRQQMKIIFLIFPDWPVGQAEKTIRVFMSVSFCCSATATFPHRQDEFRYPKREEGEDELRVDRQISRAKACRASGDK